MFAFFIIIIIAVIAIVILVKFKEVFYRLGEIERRLDFLGRKIATGMQGVAPAEAEQVAGVPPAPVEANIPSVKPEVHEQAAPAPPSQPITTPEPSRPSRTREEWETIIGGKLLNRIGALALIIGIGFFLKYAFDRNWISETIRVLIGFAVGAGLLFGGSRSHKKGFQVFAQGVIGAGIAILYLSVYASFNFYHLVPRTIAFVMMALVTALTFLQALKYDSLAVSCLGWAGGFLTPIMLSTAEVNYPGLFTYIAILDIGLIAIMLKKDRWAILDPLTLAATYLIYAISDGGSSGLFVAVPFLTIFWGLFHGLEVYRNIKNTTTYMGIRQTTAAFNTLFYYIMMYNVIDPSYHEWMGLIVLAIGSLYFLTFLVLRKRQDIPEIIFTRYVMTAIILLVAATNIQFTVFYTITFWSLEALILAWCGIHWGKRYIWKTALALMGIAAFGLLVTRDTFAYFPIADYTFLLNRRALALFVLAGSLGACAFLFKGADEKSRDLFLPVLNGGWCIALFTLLTVECNDYFRQRIMNEIGDAASVLRFTRSMTWTAIWLFYSLPLVWFGLRRKIMPVLYCGLGAAGLTIIMIAIRGIAFDPVSRFNIILNLRMVVFVLVIAGIYLVTHWIRKDQQAYPWLSYAAGILRITIVVLILLLLTGETRDLFKRSIFFLREQGNEHVTYGEITHLRNLQQLVLSGVWLFYSVALMIAGLWRRAQGLRIMAIVLFGITILKIFIYDLSFLETLYRIFSFVGLGVILLGVSYLYQRYKAIIFESVDT
jgi:uncharacterized membrane protein